MHEIDPKRLTVEPFSLFNDRWALLTAGTPDAYNTMTISWGSLGTLWGRPVATVYVSPARYTYEWMEKHDTFTVTFFPEGCRQDLAYLGSHSGRDDDKVARTSLTPILLDGTVSFAQATLTLVCRKLYSDPFDPARAPEDIRARLYSAIPPHHYYIGEIVKVLAE